MSTQLIARKGLFAQASGWTLGVGAYVAACSVLVACYWQTAQSLTWVWGHDGTYRYAFLIFPLSFCVALSLRHRLRANPPIPSIWGLAVVTALIGVWQVGHALAINLPQHFAFVALFPALVLACWGWRALRILKFPLAYLIVFAVPWGNAMVGPLQDFTARFAVHVLNLTGIPVLLNGREIITPSAVWMVANACSGVKFFIACTALGCLYAYLMYRRRWKRVLFVLLAAVVPIIANGLRVYFTVLIGETWGLHYATGTDHMIFGWQFFGTVLVLLLLSGWFFHDRYVAPEASPHAARRPVAGRMAIWPVSMLLLLAGAIVADTMRPPAPSPAHLQLSAPRLAGWTALQTEATSWRPHFHLPTGEVHATYRSAAASGAVQLFHALYVGKPRTDRALIAYGNDMYDHARSRVLATSMQPVELSGGRQVSARELRLAGTGGPRLVWYWYCVDRHCTPSPVVTKLLEAWAVVRGRDPQSSVWALSTRTGDGDTDRARSELHDFARQLSVAAGIDTRHGAIAMSDGRRPQ